MFGLPAIVVEVFLFVLGLACLVKGGDWFVDGATGIAHRFHMPELLIGATVVSIGTTIPEVMVSATAALTEGASDMAYGNAIGSIICNTALVAAITMTFRPAAVEKKSLKMPIAFFFGAAALYIAVAYATGFFSRTVGVILLAVFIAYMIICVKQALAQRTDTQPEVIPCSGQAQACEDTGVVRSLPESSDPDIILPVDSPVDPDANRMTDDYVENVLDRIGEDTDGDNGNVPVEGADEEIGSEEIPERSFVPEQKADPDKSAGSNADKTAGPNADNGKEVLRDIIRLIIGAAVIAIGAHFLVENGTLIAVAIGVPQSVIALTFVALGTSLPEFVTAITSLIKGHSDLSLGNVIGANLFNLVLVSGLAVTLAPFHIPVEKTIAGVNASLVVDIPVMVAVMLIMCLPALIKGRIYRAQGIGLLAIYAGYVIFQFA